MSFIFGIMNKTPSNMSESRSLKNSELHQIIDNLRNTDRCQPPPRKPGVLTIFIVVMMIFAVGVGFYLRMKSSGKTNEFLLNEPDFTPRARWKQPLPTPLHPMDDDNDNLNRARLPTRGDSEKPVLTAVDSANRSARPTPSGEAPTDPSTEQKMAIQMGKALAPTVHGEALESRHALQLTSQEPKAAPNSREETSMSPPPLGSPAYGDSGQSQPTNIGPTIMPSSMGLSMGMNQVSP